MSEDILFDSPEVKGLLLNDQETGEVVMQLLFPGEYHALINNHFQRQKGIAIILNKDILMRMKRAFNRRLRELKEKETASNG